MIDIAYDDGKGISTGSEHYGIPRGWWKDGDEWWLTKSAAIKELHGKKKFERILRTKNVKTQIRENPHPHAKYKTFMVYRALDLGIDKDPQIEKEPLW